MHITLVVEIDKHWFFYKTKDFIYALSTTFISLQVTLPRNKLVTSNNTKAMLINSEVTLQK